LAAEQQQLAANLVIEALDAFTVVLFGTAAASIRTIRAMSAES